VSGSWYGLKRLKNGETFNEFFTMSASGFGANIYDVSGGGPAYSYDGIAIVSSQKKIAFALGIAPHPSAVVRAVVGPFNPRKVTGTTHGWEQPDGLFIDQIRFNVTRLAGPAD